MDNAETRPLLDPTESDDIEAETVKEDVIPIIKASKTIVGMSYSVSLGYLLQNTIGLATVFSLGHVGTRELGASALSNVFVNVTGLAVGVGMATALDTLCSQAHTASRDPHVLGKHLQRALLVMALLTLPITAVWWNTENILLWVRQDPEIAALCGTYVKYLIPSLFPYLATECLKRYLQAQGFMSAHLITIIAISPVNMFMQWLFVFGPVSLGFIGAPIAVSITYTLIPLILCLYIRYIGGYECWGGFEWREMVHIKQLKEFVCLGLPGVAMICAEWWAFEMLTFGAGWFGKEALAAATIVLNTTSLSYQIPMGISVAASTKVGNCLGEGKAQSAKAYHVASHVVGFICAAMCSVMLFSIRDYWGYVWTNDEIVVKLVAGLLPFGAVYHISDALTVIGGGVLRGCGRQKLGAMINFMGYYIFGLPLSFYTAFGLGWNVNGLWFGIMSGLFITSSVQVWLVSRTDWEEQVRLCRDRILQDELSRSNSWQLWKSPSEELLLPESDNLVHYYGNTVCSFSSTPRASVREESSDTIETRYNGDQV